MRSEQEIRDEANRLRDLCIGADKTKPEYRQAFAAHQALLWILDGHRSAYQLLTKPIAIDATKTEAGAMMLEITTLANPFEKASC